MYGYVPRERRLALVNIVVDAMLNTQQLFLIGGPSGPIFQADEEESASKPCCRPDCFACYAHGNREDDFSDALRRVRSVHLFFRSAELKFLASRA